MSTFGKRTKLLAFDKKPSKEAKVSIRQKDEDVVKPKEKPNNINTVKQNDLKKSSELLTQSIKTSCKSTPIISLKSSIGVEKEVKEFNLKEIKEENREPPSKSIAMRTAMAFKNPKLVKLAKDKTREKKSIAESNDPRLKIMNEMKLDGNGTPKPRATFSMKQGVKDKEVYGSNKSKGTKSSLTTNVLSTNYSEANNNKGEYFTRVRTTEDEDIETNGHNELLGSIEQMGKLLNKREKLEIKKNEKDDRKIKQLDKMLNNINESEDSSRLLMDNNVIKRDTFIDNNFNKKIRTGEVPQENLIDEVYTNSDMRIKKYGILFNFINSNLKEITNLMHNQNNKIIEETIEGYSFENISSFLANSINEDFYKNQFDQTINLTGINVSNNNEMSTLRTKMGLSMFDKSEKTECQFDLQDSDSITVDITTKRDIK
jgi:hypothetical protein